MAIITRRTKPESMTFRWDPVVFAELRAIALETGRSLNETAETLMRWAIVQARADLDKQATAEGLAPKSPVEPK
jgi:hypothetical protein